MPISLYGRNSISGTYEFFREIALNNGDYKDEVKQQPGSEAVVHGVASDRSAIGYSGLDYKTNDVRAVPLASYNGGKCYDTSAEATYSGQYPIARFLYVYLNKEPNEQLDTHCAVSSSNIFYPRTARRKLKWLGITRSLMLCERRI